MNYSSDTLRRLEKKMGDALRRGESAAYRLGHSHGEYKTKSDNPFDPSDPDYDCYNEGFDHGKPKPKPKTSTPYGLEGLIGSRLESITELVGNDKAVSLQFSNGMNWAVYLSRTKENK